MAKFHETRSLRKERQQQEAAKAGSRGKRRQASLRRLAKAGVALAVLAAVVVGCWAALGPVRLSGLADAAALAGRRGEGFPLESGSGNVLQTALVGNHLALLWPAKLDIYSTTAHQSASLPQDYAEPAMRSAGGRVVQFDRASGKLALLSKTGELYKKELAQTLFCVGLNRRGDLAAATGAEGAASEITAWNTKQAQVFFWRCEKEYPSALQPSKNGRGLGLCLIGTQQAAAYARFVEFVYSKEEPVTDITIEDAWLYGAAQRSGSWLAVGDQAVYQIKRGAEAPTVFSYEGRKLQSFSLDENGYCAVLLEDWDARALLRVYNRSGTLVKEQSFAQHPSELICSSGKVYLRFDNILLRWQNSTDFRQSQALSQGAQNVLIADNHAYVITVSRVERERLNWSAPDQAWF